MAEQAKDIHARADSSELDIDFSHAKGQESADSPQTETTDVSLAASSGSELDRSNFAVDVDEPATEAHSADDRSRATQQDPYAELSTPDKQSAKSKSSGKKLTRPSASSKGFQYQSKRGYTETILDRLITFVSMALYKLDSLLTGKASQAVSSRRQRRLEREMELEEFMNARAKDAVGKKLAARNRKRELSEDDEEGTTPEE